MGRWRAASSTTTGGLDAFRLPVRVAVGSGTGERGSNWHWGCMPGYVVSIECKISHGAVRQLSGLLLRLADAG